MGDSPTTTQKAHLHRSPKKGKMATVAQASRAVSPQLRQKKLKTLKRRVGIQKGQGKKHLPAGHARKEAISVESKNFSSKGMSTRGKISTAEKLEEEKRIAIPLMKVRGHSREKIQATPRTSTY